MANLKDIICTGVIRCLNKIYASEFIGKLTGNADTATKALNDDMDNEITSTYIANIKVVKPLNESTRTRFNEWLKINLNTNKLHIIEFK